MKKRENRAENGVRYIFVIPDELHDKLRKFAFKENVPMATVLIELLEKFFKEKK